MAVIRQKAERLKGLSSVMLSKAKHLGLFASSMSA